jgi:hypothetical protein
MLDAKVLLSMTVRLFAFNKVTSATSDLGNARNLFPITPTPHDGMRMTVSER